MRWCKFR